MMSQSLELRRRGIRPPTWPMLLLLLCSTATSLIGCAANRATQPPALSTETPVATDAVDWKKDIGDVIAPHDKLIATLNTQEQVYTITIPRADLFVTIDGMSVPNAAGIASTFHFYRCSCGKMSVLGEFIVVDYEANDVIDALRPGNTIRISAVSPIAIGDRPRLFSVRFHGEGEATPLAQKIREAMRWTGEERMKPNPRE